MVFRVLTGISPFTILNKISVCRHVARILHAWLHRSGSGTNSRALQMRECIGVCGYAPPQNFKKIGYLRQHFDNFEEHMVDLINPKDHTECK